MASRRDEARFGRTTVRAQHPCVRMQHTRAAYKIGRVVGRDSIQHRRRPTRFGPAGAGANSQRLICISRRPLNAMNVERAPRESEPPVMRAAGWLAPDEASIL